MMIGAMDLIHQAWQTSATTAFIFIYFRPYVPGRNCRQPINSMEKDIENLHGVQFILL
jgi:hypothetical protein